MGGTLNNAMRAAIKDMGMELEKMVSDLSFLKRIGEVDEVAEIVAFVASPQALVSLRRMRDIEMRFYRVHRSQSHTTPVHHTSKLCNFLPKHQIS